MRKGKGYQPEGRIHRFFRRRRLARDLLKADDAQRVRLTLIRCMELNNDEITRDEVVLKCWHGGVLQEDITPMALTLMMRIGRNGKLSVDDAIALYNQRRVGP